MAVEQTVYVVDDDSASAASLQALILSRGCKSKVFSSAEEFLNANDVSDAGCLVLDVRLDGMSGLDLQKELVSRGSSVPVILISGHADETVFDDAMANGALAVLDKPFAGEMLCDLILQAMQG